jgi:EAL and modified HD-GYP domain-containing signal transduction protein
MMHIGSTIPLIDILLHCFPTSLDSKSVVIEVADTVDPCTVLVQACKNIKERGYILALDD